MGRIVFVKLDLDLPDHPRTLHLQRLLQIDRNQTIGLLANLWIWAMRYAEDGDLSRFSASDIASAARWPGDPDQMMEALVASGWLNGGAKLHAWEKFGGRLLQANRKAAERMAKHRRSENVRRTLHDGDANVPCEKGEGRGERGEYENMREEKRVSLELTNHVSPKPTDLIEIPLVGKNQKYGITQDQIDQWKELYPAVDVPQVLREIRGWNLANPKYRKTRNGILRHIAAWLQKEQNRAKKDTDQDRWDFLGKGKAEKEE